MKRTNKHLAAFLAVCAMTATVLSGCGDKIKYPADLTDFALEDGTFTGHATEEGPTGEGKITYTDGTVYEGAVVKGKPEGEGIMITAEGTYTGGFVGGLFQDDNAKMVFEGGTYEGAFADGKMKGDGVFTWKDGHVFTGTFDGVGDGAGELTGTGFLAYTTGLSFDGTLLDGNPKTGTFYWPNNSPAWEGEFTAFLTGYGTLDMGNGIIYYGPMNAGVLMGNEEWDARNEKVTISYPEGGAYAGETFEGAYRVNEETLKDELIGTITMKDGTVLENVSINLNFSFQYTAE